MYAANVKKLLKKEGNPEKAEVLQRFFKTGKGQYGYGDKFIGVTAPVMRRLAKMYKELPLNEVAELLGSPIHEERLLALLIMVAQFQSGNDRMKEGIYKFYLSQTSRINNWDLVDLSAREIVGDYVRANPKEKKTLVRLAQSPILWERRIAIIATYAFIRAKESTMTFQIAELLLEDKEDLMHKAVGWMLREVGKRVGRDEERAFLNTHAKTMPRTALRYALEHFDKTEREYYMKLKNT